MEFDDKREDSDGYDDGRDIDFSNESDDDIEPDRKQALGSSFF